MQRSKLTKRQTIFTEKKPKKTIGAPKPQANTAEEKPQRLDTKTSEAIKISGGSNLLQAKYYKGVAEVAVNAMEETKNPILYFVKPKIMIKESEEWRQTMLFVIRYLKKYNMQTTLDCIRTEAPGIVKKLNLKQAAKTHIIFDELMGTSEDMGETDFRYKVETFIRENNIQIPENPYTFNLDDDEEEEDI